MIASELASQLESAKRTKGGWQARCPAHEDKNPSLSVSERNGKILLNCHAGCEVRAIVAALGLSMADLFSDSNAAGDGMVARIVATYPYHDETGKLLFEVVRFEPKGFRQRRPDRNGGYVWNLDGVRRVPYRLRDVLKAKSVLVVEGERDVGAARKFSLIATCNPGGVGKWRPEYSEFLRGKHVTVIGDADAAGVAHARDVARSLIGRAASVKLIEALPQAKDLAEWSEHGGTKGSLLALIREEPEWTEPKAEGGFSLTRLCDLMGEPGERVSWLLDKILPAGGLGLLAAKPKTGKSTLARCLALAVSRGEPFLERTTLRGAVIYLALEEKRSEVRSHFRAMGAIGEENIFIHAASAPPNAQPAITVEVKRHKPVLLIIDPALRFVRVKDSNDYAQVSAALEPVLTLARENGCRTLLVHHLGKGERIEATDAILGSTALFAAVDTALVMKRAERYRTIQSRQRYGEDLPEMTLIFDPHRRTLSIGSERTQDDALAVSEEILRYLESAPSPKKEPEITDAVEGQTRIARQALRDLVKAEKVVRDGRGKKGNPYSYSKSPDSCSRPYAGTREQDSQQAVEGCVGSTPKMLVPCFHTLEGTREQECEKAAFNRTATDEMLVPASKQKPILVPSQKVGVRGQVLKGKF